MALSRAASSGQWRDDLPAVRDLGFVAVNVGGALSTLAAQTLSLVPLGSRTFRAALGSAIALAFASRLLFSIVHRALSAARPAPRLAAILAALAALTTSLSPTWQREGTVGGGAMIAVTVALAAFALASRALLPEGQKQGDPPPSITPRGWLGLGALTGLAFAESPPAALAIVVMVALIPLARRLDGVRRPVSPPRTEIAIGAMLAAIVIAALLLAPLALRPLAPRAWMDLGRAISATSLTGADAAGARTTALAAWTREVGLVSLGMAAFGAATAIVRSKTRPFIAPLVALVALDTLLPARAAGVLSADPLTALRALAIAAIAAASALGVHEVVARLMLAKIPLSRAAAALLVVFHAILAALTSEEAGYATDRSEQLAAETWTDEAFGAAPPNAAVLVRSPSLAFRLWAARLTRGERPDVLIIPAPLLGRGRVAASLLAGGEEVEPLLRSFALTGEPSELTLSTLADRRPLLIEYEPGWQKRMLSHVNVAGLWLSFAPEPLGPSDRKLAGNASFVAWRRVLDALARSAVPDAPTATIAAATLRSHASVLGSLGERDAADALLARREEVTARDPMALDFAPTHALKGVRRAVLRRSIPPRPAPQTTAKR